MKNVPTNRRIKTDEEKKVELEIKQKEAEELSKYFANTFSTESGMKVLKHIVKIGNVFGTSSVNDEDGKTSIEKTFFKDGKKELALTILNYLPRDIVINALGIK